MTYNYASFDAGHYDLADFRGPRPGSRAPDFTLQTPDGQPARLLDFDADFLVLEMGSITCPLFQGRRRAMTRLRAAPGDAAFAVLYVREAHPGSAIPAHRTETEKRACAARLAEKDGETRRILVDDLDGHAHQAYGGYPNSVFIINRNGCVVWASDWNNPRATARALEQLRAGRPARARAWFKPVPPSVSLRVLGAGGRGSLSDFLRSLPRLIWQNLIRRNLRLAFGRTGGPLPDARC